MAVDKKSGAKQKHRRGTSAARRMSLRDLNRATLARQCLLARGSKSVIGLVSELAGLQAQWPAPPYIGLWTRLGSFTRRDLAGLIEQRTMVRATTMRGTLHVVTADDYMAFRSLFEPMLAHGYLSIARDRGKGIDVERVTAEARALLEAGPGTMESIRQQLAKKHPQADARMMGYAVRMHLPLVQVPEPACEWGFPQEPSFALAESWLGRPRAKPADACELIRRYLAAFGPATARDVQTWSGVGGLNEAMEALRSELSVFQDERGHELFDLSDAPRPGGDTAVPHRFLPEFDNLLLAHADRTRFVPDAYRAGVFKAGLRVASTFLIDGLVRGAWKIERKKATATLVLTPFASLTGTDRAALVAEGEQLAAFVAPAASKYDVRWDKP